MSRYFFDTFDGEKLDRDEQGIQCSHGEISDRAVSVLPDLARDELPNGPERLFYVKVRDAEGVEIFEASLELKTRWL